MAFSLKTWVNRISEYPNRRKLTHEDGSTELVTVERAEGQISAEGNAFSAEEMNDLEDRIANEFQVLNEGKEPAKKVYGSWNSEDSNEVTIDTSELRDGAYIIFNSYTFEKPLVEFIVKFQGRIATTNLSIASSINGDKITYACGSFWCMFFAKMIEPLG